MLIHAWKVPAADTFLYTDWRSNSSQTKAPQDFFLIDIDKFIKKVYRV